MTAWPFSISQNGFQEITTGNTHSRYSQAVAVWTRLSHTDTDWSFISHADELVSWLNETLSYLHLMLVPPQTPSSRSVSLSYRLLDRSVAGWCYCSSSKSKPSMGVNGECFSASHHSARVSGLLRQCRRRWPPCLIMGHSCSDQAALSIHILQNTVRTQTGKGRDHERPRTPRPRAKPLTHLLLTSKPRCYPTDADACKYLGKYTDTNKLIAHHPDPHASYHVCLAFVFLTVSFHMTWEPLAGISAANPTRIHSDAIRQARARL